MDKERERLSRLQKGAANEVILNNYDYLVDCVNPIYIFPYLVPTRLVDQDFRQYLDHERTDKDKMMALLRRLTRSPEGAWFDGFTNALSKVPQYQIVAERLMEGNELSTETHIYTLSLYLPRLSGYFIFTAS